MHSLGVLMPTTGQRPTLWKAAASALDADVLALAWDSVDPPPDDVYQVHHTTFVHPVPGGPHNDAGAWARKHLMANTHLVTHWAFLDDDDAFTAYAIDKMRAWIADEPAALHIGCMLADDGETVAAWRDNVIRHGNIGTPTMVAPTAVLGPLARSERWPVRYDWDWRLAFELERNGVPVVWHHDVVARVRPWGRC